MNRRNCFVNGVNVCKAERRILWDYIGWAAGTIPNPLHFQWDPDALTITSRGHGVYRNYQRVIPIDMLRTLFPADKPWGMT